MEASLKRRLLIAASFGAGATVVAACILGVVTWRQLTPKPWNTTALIAREPPSFSFFREDKQSLRFNYVVENTTAADYEFNPLHFKLMFRLTDGSLAGPLSTTTYLLEESFIPAKQRGHIYIGFPGPGPPEQSPGEKAEDYHERLRAYLNEKWANVGGVVLYDQENHYQLNLPRWQSEATQGRLAAPK